MKTKPSIKVNLKLKSKIPHRQSWIHISDETAKPNPAPHSMAKAKTECKNK